MWSKGLCNCPSLWPHLALQMSVYTFQQPGTSHPYSVILYSYQPDPTQLPEFPSILLRMPYQEPVPVAHSCKTSFQKDRRNYEEMNFWIVIAIWEYQSTLGVSKIYQKQLVKSPNLFCFQINFDQELFAKICKMQTFHCERVKQPRCLYYSILLFLPHCKNFSLQKIRAFFFIFTWKSWIQHSSFLYDSLYQHVSQALLDLLQERFQFK